MVKKTLKLPVLDLAGKKLTEIELPKEVFDAKVNLPLMAQAVRVYLSNQRRAFAKTKTRGEISGSTIKIWKQKGTGRARHGDRYAPIFVGGGRAHGPKGDQSYHLSLPKKMKKAALFSALTGKIEDKKVVIVDGLEKTKGKTKEAEKIITKLLGEKFNRKKNHLLILAETYVKVKKGFRNLPYLNLSLLPYLNTHLILAHDYLIFDIKAIKGFSKEK